MKRILLTILSLFIITTGLYPAPAVTGIDSSAAPDKARVGDILIYTVTVSGTGLDSLEVVLPELKEYYPENETAVRPAAKGKDAAPGQETDPVPLYTIKSAERQSAPDGSLVIKISLAYLRTGTYTLPEIKISGDDSVPMGYRVPSVTIIETNSEGKFEEIEGPLEPPADYKAMIITVLLMLLLCGISAAAGWYLYKFLKKRRVETVPETIISPYEQFIAELVILKPEQLIASGEVNSYAFGMSMTFRRFISARFGFDAAEMTTDEIRRSLKRFMPSHLYTVHANEIMRCMDLWDISKFAEFTPSREMLSENLRSVKTVAEKVSVPEVSDVAPGV